MRLYVLITAALAGCSTVREPWPAVWRGNPAEVWGLQSVQGERVGERPGYTATIRFNPDRTISGTAACNGVSSGKLRWNNAEGETRGTFNQAGHGDAIMTTAGCRDPEASVVAGKFWSLLEEARTWRIQEDRLTITFDDGSEALLVRLSR